MKKIVIGTRGSKLALWQANFAADLIGRERVEIKVIKTKGDKIQNVSFEKMEGKAFFTKEIEDALLNNEIDLAIHSLKDLPTDDTPGLKICAIPEREDSSDLLIINKESFNPKNEFPINSNSVVGTSSLRRMSQIKIFMPEVKVEPLRGNVDTRLRKLKEKKFDAIILAYAGVKRLEIDLSDFFTYFLPKNRFIPAPSQGALAFQIRENDKEMFDIVNPFNHSETNVCVTAERSFLNFFGGGCHVPLGAKAELLSNGVELTGIIASLDGKKFIKKSVIDTDPVKAGELLADIMKKNGGDDLI